MLTGTENLFEISADFPEFRSVQEKLRVQIAERKQEQELYF